jgi:hypothetical protein
VPAEHGIGPLPQFIELCGVGQAVQADPAGRGGAAGCGGIQCTGDGLGEFLEAGAQVQVAAEPGAVEALIEQCDLAAQGGYLDGQGGQALARACAEGSACGLVIVLLGRAAGDG